VASRNICIIPIDWTLTDYLARPCETGSHIHFSRSQLSPFLEEGRVVVLRGMLGEGRREQVRGTRENVVVYLIDREGPATKHPCAAEAMNGGLSFRYGEYLAKRIRQKEPWALVLRSEIRRVKLYDDPTELLKEIPDKIPNRFDRRFD
jgi:hypothetical protein